MEHAMSRFLHKQRPHLECNACVTKVWNIWTGDWGRGEWLTSIFKLSLHSLPPVHQYKRFMSSLTSDPWWETSVDSVVLWYSRLCFWLYLLFSSFLLHNCGNRRTLKRTVAVIITILGWKRKLNWAKFRHQSTPKATSWARLLSFYTEVEQNRQRSQAELVCLVFTYK